MSLWWFVSFSFTRRSTDIVLFIILGTCEEVSSDEKKFICHCSEGYTGNHCEILIDYCSNVTCLNYGVCQNHRNNYRCVCISDSYSGSHCETTAQNIRISHVISKSLYYVALIAIICLFSFVLIMDILKYIFGIDPVESERQLMKKEGLIEIRRIIH